MNTMRFGVTAQQWHPKANYLPQTVWIAPKYGTKFHTRPYCPGLARATEIRAYMRCKYYAQEWSDGFSPREHDDNMRFTDVRAPLSNEEIERLNELWTTNGTRSTNQDNRREEQRRSHNGNRNYRGHHSGHHRHHRRHVSDRPSDSSGTGQGGQINQYQ